MYKYKFIIGSTIIINITAIITAVIIGIQKGGHFGKNLDTKSNIKLINRIVMIAAIPTEKIKKSAFPKLKKSGAIMLIKKQEKRIMTMPVVIRKNFIRRLDLSMKLI